MTRTQHLANTASPLAIALVLGLFASAFCVLLFMFSAMENERAAHLKRMEDMVRQEALNALKTLQEDWLNSFNQAQNVSATAQFKSVIDKPCVVSAVIGGDNPLAAYPLSQAPPATPPLQSPAWHQAQKLEFIEKDYPAARKLYKDILATENSPLQKITLLQAISRTSAQLQDWQAAADSQTAIIESASHTNEAAIPVGILANAYFRLIELAHSHAELKNAAALNEINTLSALLQDYHLNPLASAQRLSLAMRLNALYGRELIPHRLILAEQLAEHFSNAALHGSQWVEFQGHSLLQVHYPEAHLTLFLSLNALEAHLNQANSAQPYYRLRFAFAKHSPPENTLLEASKIPLTGVFQGLFLAIDKQPHPSSAGFNLRIAAYVFMGIFFIALLLGLYLFIGLQIRKHEKNQKLRTDVLATVSHELKTPLTSTRLLIDNLKESPLDLPQQVKDYIDILSKENYRLSSLVDNFMVFSRMERNKHAFSFETIDVNTLIAESVAVVANKYTHYTFKQSLPQSPCSLQGDESMLKTALINLLDNACKYSPNHTSININCWAQAGGIAIAVADKGIGLSPEHAKRIFERFYRVNYQAEGCGLGLNITQYIIQQHGGHIAVSSQPEKGATFTLWLPHYPKNRS